jgi:hypothetical protein
VFNTLYFLDPVVNGATSYPGPLCASEALVREAKALVNTGHVKYWTFRNNSWGAQSRLLLSNMAARRRDVFEFYLYYDK